MISMCIWRKRGMNMGMTILMNMRRRNMVRHATGIRRCTWRIMGMAMSVERAMGMIMSTSTGKAMDMIMSIRTLTAMDIPIHTSTGIFRIFTGLLNAWIPRKK